MCCLIGLVDGIALGAKVGGGRAGLEVLAQGRGEERAEDDVGTTEFIRCWMHVVGASRRAYRNMGRESHRRKTNLKTK